MSHPRPGRSFFKIGIDGLEGVPVAIKTALATTVHGSKMVQTNLGKFYLSLFCDSTGQTINKTEEEKKKFWPADNWFAVKIQKPDLDGRNEWKSKAGGQALEGRQTSIDWSLCNSVIFL